MPGPVQNASLRVFLSYSNSDLDTADRLKEALTQAGAVVWTDHERFAPGSPDWQNAIRSGIDQATYVVYIASPTAANSPYVANELAIARDLTKSVIPFWVRGDEWLTSAPAWMAHARFIDAQGARFSAGLGELSRVLGLSEPVAPPPQGETASRNSPPTPAPQPAPAAPPTPAPSPAQAPAAPPMPAPPVPMAPPPSSWPGSASSDYGPPVSASPGYGPPTGYEPPSGYGQPPAPQQNGGGEGGATKQPPQPINLERVAFAAYYPKEIAPLKATSLLIYLAVDEAGALAQVAALAAERLAGRLDQFRSGMADARMALRRGAKLRIIPTIPGFRVNPQWMDVTWDEDAQQHEFSVRAETAQEGRAAEGAVRVYQGLTLRAEIPLSIFVIRGSGASPTPDVFASAVARAYRNVFASYSHRDTPVVESCEEAARAMGDRYLRDVITLQSGQAWNDQLMRMIVEADVFQLFWSKNASGSPFVRQEWGYALTLQANRPGFIRPVYWSSNPYTIPPQLNPLHFEPLNLSALGWGPVRRFLYSLQAE